MPDSAEHLLLLSLNALDGHLGAGDVAAATSCCERIREIDERSTKNFGPEWLADMVKNKGLRLRHLEDALRVDKVVLTGGVGLKHGFLDALTGKKPWKVDRVKLELRIEF